MTEHDVLVGFRLRLFTLADELGNVSAACRAMGVDRSTYYRWKRKVDRWGLEALAVRERRRPRMPNQIGPHLEQKIIAFALGHPGLGPRRISAELAREKWGGVRISEHGIWLADPREPGVGEADRDVARAVGSRDAERGVAPQVLVGADLEMARIGVPFEVRRLEQPRVRLAHRARPGQRTQIGRPLLAPALAEPPRHPTQQHRPDQHRRHRRHQQEDGLARLPAESDPYRHSLRLPSPHARTVVSARSQLHTFWLRMRRRRAPTRAQPLWSVHPYRSSWFWSRRTRIR